MAQATHRVVREQLLARLSGQTVGAAIAPERRLAAEFGVSRGALRRVIDELVREGHLTRRQGSGTYVAQPPAALTLTMTSFTEDMLRRGHEPSSRTLRLEVVPADAEVARRLEVPSDTPIVRAERLRLADDQPMAIETLSTPADAVPGITGEDLERFGFYDLLLDRYGVELARGVQTIEPTLASPDEAAVLGVGEGSPALCFERVTRDVDGRAVEFVRSLYRGDRYRLVADLVPARSRGTGTGSAIGRGRATTP